MASGKHADNCYDQKLIKTLKTSLIHFKSGIYPAETITYKIGNLAGATDLKKVRTLRALDEICS